MKGVAVGWPKGAADLAKLHGCTPVDAAFAQELAAKHLIWPLTRRAAPA